VSTEHPSTGSFEAARADAERLIDVTGVVGVGEGTDAEGAACIVLMVDALTLELQSQVPRSLHGIPVVVEEIGIPRAYEPTADSHDEPGSDPQG